MYPARPMLNPTDSRTRNRSSTSRHTAYTLLEVMIVLSIVVGFLALAWPRMRGLAAKNELKAAAVELKAACSEARDLAVRSGRAVTLRYQLGDARFQVVSESDTDTLDHSSQIHNLPAGIEFSALEQTDDGQRAAELPDTNATNVTTQNRLAAPEGTEFESITFYPEGRSSSAAVVLATQDAQRRVELNIRGLTGGVKIGPVTNSTIGSPRRSSRLQPLGTELAGER